MVNAIARSTWSRRGRRHATTSATSPTTSNAIMPNAATGESVARRGGRCSTIDSEVDLAAADDGEQAQREERAAHAERRGGLRRRGGDERKTQGAQLRRVAVDLRAPGGRERHDACRGGGDPGGRERDEPQHRERVQVRPQRLENDQHRHPERSPAARRG